MTGLKTTEESFLQESAETMLRASEEKYRLITQHMGDVVWQTTPDLIIRYVTPSAKRLFGYEPQEIVGRHLTDLLTPEGKELVQNRYPDIMSRLAEHKRFDTEVSVVEQIRKDGTTVWTEVVTVPTLDSAGKFIGFQGVTRDVSKRKENEEALRASEAKYRNLVESISDVIFEIDAMGVLTYISPVVRNVFGYEAEDFIGKTFLEFVHPEDIGFLIKRFAELTKGVEYPLEYRVVGKSGEVRHVRTYTKPIMKENAFEGARGTLIDITERKRIDEALRQSEDKFAKVFHFAPALMTISNVDDGTYVDVNDKFCEVSGFSRSESIGKTSVDLGWISPEDRMRLIEELHAHGSVSGMDLKLLAKDKRQIHCIYNGELIQTKDRQLLLSIALDITERKKIEETLRERERVWATLINNLPGFVYRCANDRDWTMEYISHGCLEVTGYAPDDFVGNNNLAYNDIVHPDYREPLWEKWQKLIINKGVFEEEYPIIAKGGEARWVWERGRGIFSKSGRLLFLEGFISDITERKQFEESQKLLSTAIEQAAEAVIITDASGVIQYVNTAQEILSGYSRDELIGQTPNVLNSDFHSSSFYEQIWDTIGVGKAWTGRFINRKKDGTEYHEDATISPVYDKSGNLTNFVAVKHDVTKQIALQEQLLQSQKLEAIGTLAGGFAHDFNNKLQVISGYVELILCNEELPDNLKHNMDAIGQAVHASAELIREMLVFSRKTIVKFERLNLNILVTRLHSMLVPVMPKMITIDLVLAEDLWPINAAPNQIDQILMNLSVNARDAMPEGGKLTIRTKNTTLDEEYCRYHPNIKPGPYVLLSVTDTGSGMDEATVKRIFEPFFTTKEKDKGTGLGLSVVYGIVEGHGGMIICDSEPSVGTTFKIYFPVIEEVSEEQYSEKKAPPRGQG